MYNGHIHKIQLLGHNNASLGSWVAYNNIDKTFAKLHYHSLTHLKNGVYVVQDARIPFLHPADPNGPYGSYGIIRFHYPGHPGVGVHSGRANAKRLPGAQHPTHGCIRTTDEAMASIIAAIRKDPLKTIAVVGNSETSIERGKSKHPALNHSAQIR
jgi:hypothetical protein